MGYQNVTDRRTDRQDCYINIYWRTTKRY